MYLGMYFQSLLSVNLTQIFEACGLSSSISYTQYLTPHLGGHLPTFTQKTGPRSSSTLRMLRPSRQARQARQALLGIRDPNPFLFSSPLSHEVLGMP